MPGIRCLDKIDAHHSDRRERSLIGEFDVAEVKIRSGPRPTHSNVRKLCFEKHRASEYA
jgi:hypothetical protein